MSARRGKLTRRGRCVGRSAATFGSVRRASRCCEGSGRCLSRARWSGRAGVPSCLVTMGELTRMSYRSTEKIREIFPICLPTFVRYTTLVHMLETERARLKQLVDKLDQLPRDGFEGVSDPALQALVAECCEATSALQAVTATVVGEWDQRLLWASDGATSPQAWLRSRGEMERTKPLVDTAQVLRDHAPLTAQALAAGELSYEKAAALATAVRTDTSPKLAAELAAAFATDEAALVASTRRLTIKETRARAAHWR